MWNFIKGLFTAKRVAILEEPAVPYKVEVEPELMTPPVEEVIVAPPFWPDQATAMKAKPKAPAKPRAKAPTKPKTPPKGK